MRGVIGREVDRETGPYRCGNQAPVVDGDRIVTENGLVGEGDGVLTGVGGNELLEERTVDLGAISGEVARLGIAPQTTRPKRRDLCTELRPGHAGQAAGYTIPVHGEGAGLGVAAVFVERAARPT